MECEHLEGKVRIDPLTKQSALLKFEDRLCLNYKGLAYKTEWLEYPEIAPHCLKHGIPATSTKPDGTPFYTLLAIYDPSTGSYISDSFAIAAYLDATYPSTPSVFPHGTQGLQASFESAFTPQVRDLWPAMYKHIFAYLNDSSANYMGSRQVPGKGLTVMELIPSVEEVKIIRAKTEEDLWKVHGWYQNAGRSVGDPGPFMMGEIISWTDFVVCAHFLSWRTILGVDSKEWKEMEKWNTSRWGALVKSLEKYQGVH